jgi:hypothetical protein
MTFTYSTDSPVPPDREIARLIEQVNMMAMAGTLRHMCFIGVLDSGKIVTATAGPTFDPFSIIGAMHIMQERYTHRNIPWVMDDPRHD